MMKKQLAFKLDGTADVCEETESNQRYELHMELCKCLNGIYKAKNNDYGDSFTAVRKKYPNAILIRLNDKLSRLEALMGGREQKITDENIKDTLLDMANYCLMELVEMTVDANGADNR